MPPPLRLLLAVVALPRRTSAAASCLVPPAPPDTVYEEACTAGSSVVNNQMCKIGCNPGYKQGSGTYTLTCHCTGSGTGETCKWSAAYAAQCTACGKNHYNDVVGSSACRTCPSHSVTTNTGAKSVNECECSPGFETQKDGSSLVGCDACEKGFYKSGTGSSNRCTACTLHATTKMSASTGPDSCKCNPGYSGLIKSAADHCTACDVGFYLGTNAAQCLKCPTSSITAATAAAAVTDCLCLPGFSGAIQTASSTCKACAIGTYKSARGAAACSNCPDNAVTAHETSLRLTDCRCSSGCECSKLLSLLHLKSKHATAKMCCVCWAQRTAD